MQEKATHWVVMKMEMNKSEDKLEDEDDDGRKRREIEEGGRSGKGCGSE